MTLPDTHQAEGQIPRQYFSSAFGLTIASDFLIGELPQISTKGPHAVDLEIMRGDGIRVETSASYPLLAEFRTADGPPIDHLHWHNVGSFRISGTNRIEYEMHPDMGLDVVTLPLLGTVMALLLHRRGLLVLHGSAVEIGKQAVVFVGDKGAGKSTTAAALVAVGRRMLTDDIVALQRLEDGRIQLLPGYGQIKLTHTATDAIALPDSSVMERPFEGFTKHRHVLGGSFDLSPLVVSDIHILERGERLQVDLLTGHYSLTAVMRFAYLTRFGAKLFASEDSKLLLNWCADVARTVRVSHLEVPSTISELATLDRFLADELTPSHEVK